MIELTFFITLLFNSIFLSYDLESKLEYIFINSYLFNNFDSGFGDFGVLAGLRGYLALLKHCYLLHDSHFASANAIAVLTRAS